MNHKEFERKLDDKVKTMSAHDIIMAMVEGLRDPRAGRGMGYFGSVSSRTVVGIAAANAVFHIIDVNKEEVGTYVSYMCLGANRFFVRAVDRLSQGNLKSYNICAELAGIAPITPLSSLQLPWLGFDYPEDQLQKYVELAKHQLTTKNQQ